MGAKQQKAIRKPEDHDWTGEACVFAAQVEEGKPVIDVSTGRIQPGDVKARGVVLGQTYIGRVGVGQIPDFEITVQCKSGKYRIGLLDNNFQLIL